MFRLLPHEFRQTLDQRRILEIGCGSGFWLRQFIEWGAQPDNLTGVDLLQDRIDQALGLCAPGVHLTCQDASALSFEDAQFDLVLQATAFTSMLNPAMRAAVAAEMLRTLKSGGYVLWYDFFVSNPWNADVRGIGKGEIRRLFPGCSIQLKRLTLAPPLARVLSKISRTAYQLGSAANLFYTHYLGLLQKRLA